MRRDLGASSAVLQIAVTLGKLMLGAFMLAGGVAGDVYGRRRVLVLGALGMVGASLLTAVAQTGGMLLVARALDGLASAAIAPMALALITGAFSQSEQARVIGLFLGLSGLGAALGPLGAGLVVQAQGWRGGFLVPAAVAALGGLGVFMFASGNRRKNRGPAPGWHRRAHLCCRSARAGVRDHSDQPGRLAASLGFGIPRRWHRCPPGLHLVGTPRRGSRIGRYTVSPSDRLRGHYDRVTDRTGHGGALPLLDFLQTVQKVSQISSILRLMPMMVAAAAFAPVAGRLTAKIGPERSLRPGYCLWRPVAAC